MKFELNKLIKKINSLNEIRIFQAMAISLNNKTNTNAIYIRETHGRKGWVEFSSQKVNSQIIREIADLLIVVNNRKEKEIRISFLQAKYHKKSINPFLHIHADYFQWELLFNRSIIKSIGKILFPQNILSFTNYKSISSYGTFYYDINNEIDMLYTIPDFLSPTKLNPTKITKSTILKFPGYLNCPQKNCYTQNNNEIVSTCSIDKYEYFLLNGLIGAPINNEYIIKQFIGNNIQNLINNLGENEILSEMSRALGYENNINNENKYGNMSLLIINTDGLESTELS